MEACARLYKGSLWLDKQCVASLGNPNHVKVTVREVEPEPGYALIAIEPSPDNEISNLALSNGYISWARIGKHLEIRGLGPHNGDILSVAQTRFENGTLFIVIERTGTE
jgi:hypothetical protein